MTKKLVSAFLIALMFAVFSFNVASAQSNYIVKPGDTLFKIALAHGVDMYALASANGILNPSNIYAGQVLTIPGGVAAVQTTSSTTAGSNYQVKRGDTLGSIALNYGINMWTLANANGITNPSNIYAGQWIKIPSGAAASGTGGQVASYGGERWIDVNLSAQTLTAYEGNTPVYSMYISSGLNPYPTVTGQFRVYLRYKTQDMNGYLLGYDYYVPNVPNVMYFYRGYAIHGTYWHSNFGQPMSHGCVNTTVADSEWLYNWSSHGTLVNVHY